MYGIYDDGEVIAQFVTPLTLRSNRPIFTSDTLSLKRQTSFQGAQRWELTTQLVPLSFNAEDLFVYFVTRGHSEPLEIIVPQNYGVIMKRTSNSAPVANGTIGSSSVTINNNIGIIPKGTFVRFENHTKVYMVTKELNGSGVLSIFPALIKKVEDETMKHRDDVIMPTMLDTSVVTGMSYTDGILMDNGTITMVEAL